MSRSCAGCSFDIGSPPVFVRCIAGLAGLAAGCEVTDCGCVGVFIIELGLDLAAAAAGAVVVVVI